MKKILSFAVLVAISLHVNAQNRVNFGVKAGANFSTLSNLSKSEMLPGFYVGAVSEIKFTEKFSFQPELVYSSQGAKNVYSETIANVTASHHNHDKLAYVNVPLLAKYFVTKSLSVELGPQLGFLFKATNKDEITIGGTKTNQDKDFKNEVNTFDFGVAAGLSYDVSNGFFIGARYNFGLANVGKTNQYYSQSKNGVTQLGVGYKF